MNFFNLTPPKKLLLDICCPIALSRVRPQRDPRCQKNIFRKKKEKKSQGVGYRKVLRDFFFFLKKLPQTKSKQTKMSERFLSLQHKITIKWRRNKVRSGTDRSFTPHRPEPQQPQPLKQMQKFWCSVLNKEVWDGRKGKWVLHECITKSRKTRTLYENTWGWGGRRGARRVERLWL